MCIYRLLAGSLVKVGVIVVELLHLIAFGQQDLQVIILPAGGRKILKEEECILELHFFQVFGELEEESSDYVAVELRETFFLWEVGVPESDYLDNVEFSGQVAANPAIREVDEIDIKGV